jgi:hypothetical protein
MGQQGPTPGNWRWHDETNTILHIAAPVELTPDGLASLVEAARAALDGVSHGVAVAVDLSATAPPPDIVDHFREIFTHPLLQHPHLDRVALIVDDNRPLRVLTTIFRRLAALFGVVPIAIVDTRQEALAWINDQRAPGDG